MAQHVPLTNFLSRLNTDVGPGTEKEFLASTGRRLAAAQILPEEEFSKQGQPIRLFTRRVKCQTSTSDETYTNVIPYWLTTIGL